MYNKKGLNVNELKENSLKAKEKLNFLVFLCSSVILYILH